MQTDEMRPKLPADPDAPAPTHPHPRRGGRLGLAAAGLAVALVVALFAVLSLQRGSGAASPPVVPASWQTYRDPAGLFSLRMPQGWSAHLETSSETFGDRTGSATDTTEFLSVSDPEQGTGSAKFYVNAAPISTAFERHWYCQAFPSANSGFQGIPASSMGQAVWLFDTANAHFQLDVWIPGVLEPPHSSPMMPSSMPTATPLPAATVAVDRQVLATMLGSFAPTDPPALACS